MRNNSTMLYVLQATFPVRIVHPADIIPETYLRLNFGQIVQFLEPPPALWRAIRNFMLIPE